MDIYISTDDDEFIPEYASKNASGADLRAKISETIILKPGESVKVPTGIYLEIPNNYEVQIRPRSGLALKHQITVLNTPGTIDADYRGEICVILINHGKCDFLIEPKMRIAQMVLSPTYKANFIKKEELSVTSRGGEGFGHTGCN